MLAGIILAGETPGSPDPLAVAVGVPKKALIPIGGRPMVSYVYDALDGVERIGTIVVIGLTKADGVPFSSKAILHPGFGDLLDNVLGALNLVNQHAPDVDQAVIASSDIPLITSEVVNDFIDACIASDYKIYYSIVEESVMEAAYPGSGRSFRRLGDQAYAGGDLYMVSTRLDRVNLQRARQAIGSRKSGLGMARVLGLKALFKFVLGRLTLDETIEKASAVLGVQGTAVISPHASLGMDADKPHQLEMVRNILEMTGASQSAGHLI